MLKQADLPASIECPVDYWIVDEFLADLLTARALHTAFQLGWVDWIEARPCTREALIRRSGGDPLGAALLLRLLEEGGVVRAIPSNSRTDDVTWTPRFRHALAYRDLLQAKLDFTLVAAADFQELFTELVADPASFQAQSRTFRLFTYFTERNFSESMLAQTQLWVHYTSALTRYEGPRGLDAIQEMEPTFAPRDWFDIGGNSGEFASQIASRFPTTAVHVVDLPVVCEVGRRYLEAHGCREHVTFHPGNAWEMAWPCRAEAISFKSMLHDWPDDFAAGLLKKAVDYLAPGGRIIVYERDQFTKIGRRLRLGDLSMMAFARCLRGPDFYRRILQQAGLDVSVCELSLDVPFFVLIATHPHRPSA